MTVAIMFVIAGGFVMPAGHAEDYDDDAPILFQETGYAIEVLNNNREADIVLGITLDLQINEITVGDERFSTVTIPDAGTTLEPGQPELPLISNTYRISNTRDPVVTIRPLQTRTIYLDNPVLPSQQCDSVDIKAIEMLDQDMYDSDDSLPVAHLTVGSPEIFRDLRVAQITWCPVTYYPASGRLDIVESAEMRISAGEKSTENVFVDAGFPITQTWGTIYKAVIPNFDETDVTRDGEEHYLAVIKQGTAGYLSEWEAWKEIEGYDVTILEIPTGTSTSALFTLIQNEYNTNRPTFVMLAGRESEIPVYTSSYSYYWNGHGWSGSYSDDAFYARLDGEDYLPDVLVSRLPGDNSIQTIMTRTLFWETTPNMAENYYGSAAMAAAGNYTSQEETKMQVRERLMRVHNYTDIPEYYDWGGSTINQLMSKIDSGISILNYRGEGWTTGWSCGFQTEEVDSLNNYNKPLIVTSIGCGVANFTGGYCFGEAWMRLGSTTTVRGAVAFCGPTWNTHTTFNNWLDRGMYRGLAYDDLSYVSQAFLAGKMYMRAHYPTYPDIITMYFGLFTMFGTPDTRYRTILPTEPVYGFAYSPTSNDRYFAVRTAENWRAVNAKVVLDPSSANRSVLTLGSMGQAQMTLPPETDSIDVHIAGYNMVPFTDTIDLTLGAQGRLLITEVKPDINTDGIEGDMVELYNADDISIDLKNMIVTDLDLYDIPFITQSLILEPGKFVVITFVGPKGQESIAVRTYGYDIHSRAFPDFDSDEDQCVLRNATGQIIDAMAWCDNDNQPATRNDYRDLSRFTGPTSLIDVRADGWWDAPDDVLDTEYEQYTVNWEQFAGTGGPGSMQRVLYEELDDLYSFEVLEQTSWGELAGPPPCMHHGDVNRDFQVTAADAQQTFLIALGLANPSFYESCAADCNGDDEITAGDAQGVFLSALGMPQCVDDVPVPTPTPVWTSTPTPTMTSPPTMTPTPIIPGDGEDCSNPIVIEAVPFLIDGSTVSYLDDYDEQCPYGGSAPDIVYAYQPTEDQTLSLTLCTGTTNYDTKLYVYEGTCTGGTSIACNDDECSAPGYQNWVSMISGVPLTAGDTYYIVVDGYGSNAGNYTLDISVVDE